MHLRWLPACRGVSSTWLFDLQRASNSARAPPLHSLLWLCYLLGLCYGMVQQFLTCRLPSVRVRMCSNSHLFCRHSIGVLAHSGVVRCRSIVGMEASLSSP